MNWQDLCEDRSLAELPYRIELNRHGQIVMSPHRSYHSIYQGRIIRLLAQLLPQGEVMAECAIETADGVRVADAAWATQEKVRRYFDAVSWPESPEIVVEVVSPSNSETEIASKREQLFARGAVEFWRCDCDGCLTFHDRSGPLPASKVCPEFPQRV